MNLFHDGVAGSDALLVVALRRVAALTLGNLAVGFTFYAALCREGQRMADVLREADAGERAEGIQEFDPADCVPPEDNRPVKDGELQELLGSIRAEGQLVAGILCRHPTLPGKYLVVAGASRWRCCQILGIPFWAELIDRLLSRAEIIRIRVKENVLRKNPNIYQLCKEVCDYKAERGLQTWLEVGAELNLLPATMSRITSVRRIPPEWRDKAELLCPSVCWLIAPLKDVEAMRRAFAFATTPDSAGKLPSRETVQRFIEPLKGKKSAKKTKAKTLQGSIDGRKVAIGILPEDSTDTVIEWLKAVAARMGKYRDMPPDNLSFLFGR